MQHARPVPAQQGIEREVPSAPAQRTAPQLAAPPAADAAAGETPKSSAEVALPPHGIHKASGRVLFTPTKQWREVPEGAICPAGLEFKMDVTTGKNQARLPPRGVPAAKSADKAAPERDDARREDERRDRDRDRRDRDRSRGRSRSNF